jgi:hypothetical protein
MDLGFGLPDVRSSQEQVGGQAERHRRGLFRDISRRGQLREQRGRITPQKDADIV